MEIREMRASDYDAVRSLWMTIKGFAIRSMDDSREGVNKFIERNPGLSTVAIEDGHIVRDEAQGAYGYEN